MTPLIGSGESELGRERRGAFASQPAEQVVRGGVIAHGHHRPYHVSQKDSTGRVEPSSLSIDPHRAIVRAAVGTRQEEGLNGDERHALVRRPPAFVHGLRVAGEHENLDRGGQRPGNVGIQEDRRMRIVQTIDNQRYAGAIGVDEVEQRVDRAQRLGSFGPVAQQLSINDRRCFRTCAYLPARTSSRISFLTVLASTVWPIHVRYATVFALLPRSILLSLLLWPSNVARLRRSGDRKGLFGNTSPAPTFGNSYTLACPGRRR